MKRGLALAAAVTLVATATAAAAPTAKRPPQRPTDEAIPSAQVALERALAYFAPDRVNTQLARAAVRDPRGVTMALRDLAATSWQLTGTDRRLAEQILARPTDTGAGNYTAPKGNFRRNCPANFCVHWVTTTRDAPSLTDKAPKNGLPDWIDKVKSVMTNVWSKEIATYGYRKPKVDGPFGGHRGGNPNSKLDIFIQDIGRNDIYGYCTTDDPKRNIRRDVSAYCVLDDDYARTQFPQGAYGLNALKVTAAHEFHHASQYAYDWKEDRAFMEATATNMEADVYGSIHDNYQYFNESPLRPQNENDDGPWWPIDMFDRNFGNQYGDWIFYRFLEEYFGGAGTNPTTTLDRTINKQIWLAAATPGANSGGKYSTQALVETIAARGNGANFQDAFVEFGWANAAPSAWYRDGAGYPAAGTFDLGSWGAGDSDTVDWPMFHMANDYAELQPDTLNAPTSLDFTFHFPAFTGGWKASVLVFYSDFTFTMQGVQTNASGEGSISGVDFNPDPHPTVADPGVERVVLVLTNHGTHFDQCGTVSLSAPVSFSCRGNPLDDFATSPGPFFTFDVAAN